MRFIRLLFAVALVSLCVFGLPEGCLVFASHAAGPHLSHRSTGPGLHLLHQRAETPAGAAVSR